MTLRAIRSGQNKRLLPRTTDQNQALNVTSGCPRLGAIRVIHGWTIWEPLGSSLGSSSGG